MDGFIYMCVCVCMCVQHPHMMDKTPDDWSLQYVLTNAFIIGANGNVTLPGHIGDIIQYKTITLERVCYY